MIWQASLFSRFIFRKVSKSYELKLSVVVQWMWDRFASDSATFDAVQLPVRRYLAYLSARGCLHKLPYKACDCQGYIVVHGPLHPQERARAKPEVTEKTCIPPSLAFGVVAGGMPSGRNDDLTSQNEGTDGVEEHYASLVHCL